MTPVNQQLPLDYRYEDGNLYKQGVERSISNFYVVPTTAYSLNSQTLPCCADIEIVRNGERIPLTKRVQLDELTPAWWKSPPAGCAYYPGTWGAYRHVHVIFQCLLGELKPVQLFRPTALGWTRLPEGEAVYVTGSGVIGATGFLPEESIEIPEALKKYRLEKSNAPFDDALDYFWSLFYAVPGITDILLANTLSAILLPCFKAAGVEPRFPVILEGPSEAKKTTLACLTSCLYNRRSAQRSCVATLTSTSRALETRGADLRHTVLVVDDLFPDGGSALEQKALNLVRDLANQIPREVRQGKTVVGVEMECAAVITAERFPDCSASTRTRCLRLVLSEAIPNATLTSLQEDSERLTNIFEAFIESLASTFEEVTNDICKDFQKYRQSRAQADAPVVKSERLAEIGFILYTSLSVFLQALSASDEILEPFMNRLNESINWQLSFEAAISNDAILAPLMLAIQQNPNEFFWRDGCACIRPERLCEILQLYHPQRSLTTAMLFDALRKAELLHMDRSGVATKKIKGLGRCLCIDTRRLGFQ